MKIRDRLFLFISVVLILLFAIRVLKNIQELPRFDLGFFQIQKKAEEKTKVQPRQLEILTGLEQEGLEPQEAKYYEVID